VTTRAGVVGTAGLVAALAAVGVVAASGDMPLGDALRLSVAAVLCAVGAGAAARLVLQPLRRHELGLQVAVISLVPVLAVAVGVIWAANDMFLMGHDVWVVGVMLVAAGSAGLGVAGVLGRRISFAGRSLGALTRLLPEQATGALDGIADADLSQAPGELGRLAAELHLTRERLAEARSQRDAAEHSRRELVAWVSHDLRTPLSGIRAMVEALEDGVVADPATVHRYHATIRKEADRLAGLVDDLFELSRIHAGAVALDLEAIPLDELLGEALASASIAASSKDIAVRYDPPQPAPTLELSSPEMMRVILNLLDNAIRHTPPHGAIEVTAAVDESGRTVEVCVQDSCGGIPEADLDRVFEPAFRGDSARTPADSGGGLGLAVARGFVTAHHGHIEVCNHPPGCRFTIRLPLPEP
jgi:signal transduction histidine kinase